MPADWNELEHLAAREVEETLNSLPEPLRERARALPITFQPIPNEDQQLDGIEEDTLGLFVGPPYADQEATTFPVPPQVILFLSNIWEMVDGDEEAFRDEVRTTLLHELGHYLGLDEDDLVDRGLE